ncbi:MAG: hypothetical protein HY769_05825 [Candidatus Stahlbacteria bacterium]|nr:hypothetical protein [Candidatus Stahlbacteria bacterium]
MEQDTEKIYFSTHYFESEPTKLTTLYKKTYGGEVNTFVALGFDAANLLLLTIQQAKGISPVDIFHSLLNIQTFNGVTGDFTYQGRKDPLKSIFILQLQRGKLSLVQKL